VVAEAGLVSVVRLIKRRHVAQDTLMAETGTGIRIRAQAVSRGIAVGKAVCLYGKRRQYFHTQITEDQIERELRRLRAAVRLAIRQLGKLHRKNGHGRTNNASGILEYHKMMLSDAALIGKIEERISTEHINAEWAVKLVTDEHLAQYRSIVDKRFRERRADLEDVTERLLSALGGGRRTSNHLEKGSIVIAREINPSTLIELSEYDPAGIITEHGGWTSHTFILAREMGVPAVTGVRRALRRIQTGDDLIVDGFSGEIVVEPSGAAAEAVRTKIADVAALMPKIDTTTIPQTLDGRDIVIRANADIPGGYELARSFGARGVGLFRSEYIFNRFRGVPSEDEQYEAYSSIARMTRADGVRIRTFDFGSEELDEQPSTKCKNPALGLRAIRLSLEHETQFRDQIRALLRASFNTKIDIIVPMISDLSELRRVKVLIDDEKAALSKANVKTGTPRLGVMVEVPSTVFMIEEILDEADVICLGTNDLVQYLLAVDRDNEEVSSLFRTLSPAVIRAVNTVLDACSKRSIPCVACGEMAGSPYYVPILIGLGATELSMNPKSIPRVRRLISGIAYDEARELCRLITPCRTAAEVEDVNKQFIASHWSHLYDIPPSG
jgi:phosphoenolpyruvate-protein phosphotransferase (PTS system enzyme I)